MGMWGWQSLDRATKAWYEPFTDPLGRKRWLSDALSPMLMFGVARIHKEEEEAAARVEAFYQDYLRIQKELSEREHQCGWCHNWKPRKVLQVVPIITVSLTDFVETELVCIPCLESVEETFPFVR
jgi:hypothetical protein